MVLEEWTVVGENRAGADEPAHRVGPGSVPTAQRIEVDEGDRVQSRPKQGILQACLDGGRVELEWGEAPDEQVAGYHSVASGKMSRKVRIRIL